MKVNKRIIIIVAMLLLIFVFPKESKAQVITKQWGEKNELTWSVNTKTKVLTLSGKGESTEEFAVNMDAGSKYDRLAPWDEWHSVIEKVIIEDGITSISQGSFTDFNKLKSITIPSSVKSIEDLAFYGDHSLREIQLPDSIERIGDEVFFDCRKLKRVTYGSNVKEMGYHVFGMCPNLKEIIVPESNKSFMNKDGILFSKDKGILYACPAVLGRESYVIPDTVKKVEGLAFSCNRSLKNVTIGKNVTLIRGGAFYDCKNLREVHFEKKSKLKKITNYFVGYGDDCEDSFGAFEGCNSLKEISLPDSLEAIGETCFRRCNNLKRIRFGRGLKIFLGGESYAQRINFHFETGDKLESIQVASDNPYFSSEKGVLYNKDKTILCRYPTGKKNKKFIVPSSVKQISNFSFSECTGIERVILTQNVTKIGWRAFLISHKYSNKFKYIYIPKTVTSIGEDAIGFDDWHQTLREDFIIYGKRGSAAEKYAKEYEIKFKRV